MRSFSQVLHIEDCFETLDEAKVEIRRLNAERAETRALLANPEAVHTMVLRGTIALDSDYIRKSDEQGEWAILKAKVLTLVEDLASYAPIFAGDIGSRGPSQREALVGDLRVKHVIQSEEIITLLSRS